MGRCDNQKEPIKTVCNSFDQLISDSRKSYEKVDDKDQDHFKRTLTWLDQELHSFFKEIGIKSDISVSDLNELAQKIDDLGAKINQSDSISTKIDLTDLAKEQELKDLAEKINDIETAISKIGGLDRKVDQIKGETDKISSLTRKTDLDNLIRKTDLSNLNQKVDDIKTSTDKINGIKSETDKINSLAKDQNLKSVEQKIDDIKISADKINDLDTKVSNIKSETDQIVNLVKKDDLKSLVKTDDLTTLNQQIVDLIQKDEALNKVVTDKAAMVSQKINSTSQEVELTIGNKILDKYEAEIKLVNSNTKIGTFPSEGYYFYDGKIYIYDHLRSEVSIDLPQQYHFLKIVKTEDGKYKLAFCNKYGQGYYNVSYDYKLINPTDIKSMNNVDFEKYHAKDGSNPSFIAKMSSSSYQNSSQHGVDVYEIGNEKK